MQNIMERTYTMKAGETTLNQHCVACLDTATEGQVIRPAAANAKKIAGVLRDSSCAAGEPRCFAVAGITTCIAAGAIAIGDKLVVAGVTGKVTPISGTQDIVGEALSATTADGDHVTVLLAIPNDYTS